MGAQLRAEDVGEESRRGVEDPLRLEGCDALEILALLGAVELDGPEPAVGLPVLSSMSRAVTKIPIPSRATMVIAAAMPRRRGGSGKR